MIEFILGVVMLIAGGAILGDVPFKRFLPAIILLQVGSTFLALGMKAFQ